MSLIKPRFYNRDNAHSDAACDAAELRVVHAKGIGKWWVEPNLSRFNDADREQTHKGRKEFPDREAAIKYARGTGKTFIVNDACDAMDANFKVGDTVRVDVSYSRNVNNGIGKVVKVDGASDIVVEFAGHGTVRVPVSYATLVNSRAADACDAAEFHVGQRVRAKDPAYEYSEGKALGAGMFTVKEVNNNGDVKLEDYGDVWISPSALVEANDACEDSSELNNAAKDAAEKGSRELQNVFYGALHALKKVADRAKVEGAQTLVDAANSAAKELISKSYAVF